MKVPMLSLCLIALLSGSARALPPLNPLQRKPVAPSQRAEEKLPAPLPATTPDRLTYSNAYVTMPSPYAPIHYETSPPAPAKATSSVPAHTSDGTAPAPTAPYRPSSRQPRQRPQYLPPPTSGSSSDKGIGTSD
jgi:hypothetical protein